MLHHRTPAAAIAIALIVITGCGDDGTAGDAGVGDSGGRDSGAAVTDVIVSVPEGAIDPPIEVTVTLSDVTYPDPSALVSPVYEIGPSGTTFEVPVTVGLPINPDTPAGSTLRVVRFDDAIDDWVELPGTMIVGTNVFAQTDHFSPFAAISSPDAAACNDMWSGGPGDVVPFLVPGNVVVSDATRTAENIQNSGPAQMALGSTWTSTECSVTVSGDFGPGLVGDGAWTDYSNAGGGGAVPQSGGAFSFTLRRGDGPYLGLADPCNAATSSYLYQLNVHLAGDCPDRCIGVSCTADDGNVCTTDTCNPATGLCEQMPNAATCGSSGAGRCIEGLCIVEVDMGTGESGTSKCAAEGLTCADSPVLTPPVAACLAFNPGASVSMDANGWEQGVYCNDNMGLACEGRVNDCHHCPACNAGLNCAIASSDLIERMYVSCVP